jgi:hypothetical protein
MLLPLFFLLAPALAVELVLDEAVNCGIDPPCRGTTFCFKGNFLEPSWALRALEVSCSEELHGTPERARCVGRMGAEDSVTGWTLRLASSNSSVMDLSGPEIPSLWSFILPLIGGEDGYKGGPEVIPISPFGTTCFRLDSMVLSASMRVTTRPNPDISWVVGIMIACMGLALAAPRIARWKPFYASIGACGGIICIVALIVIAIFWIIKRKRESPSSVQIGIGFAAQLGTYVYVRRYLSELFWAYLGWIAILFLCVAGSAAIATVRFFVPGRIPDSAVTVSTLSIQFLAAMVATVPLQSSPTARTIGLFLFMLIGYGLTRNAKRQRRTDLSYTDLQVRKLLNPEGARSEEEKQFLEWLVENHRRIRVASPDTDGEVE